MPLYGTLWQPKMIGEICNRQCYTGDAYYNRYRRVPNPNNPIGDLNLEMRGPSLFTLKMAYITAQVLGL